MLPPLTYLTVDSLQAGVGASQVVPYVTRLARRGLDVSVHSFEPSSPGYDMEALVAGAGVRWVPHRFGGAGARGGLGRVLRGAVHLRGSILVHARSDLPAASALLARRRHWVWDVRSLWADQRIALGMLHPASAAERALRLLERRAATSSTAIVTLSAAAIDVLEQRHGPGVRQRAVVVPTCVDLERFTSSPMPDPDPTVLLLSGTLNAFYDVPTMLRLAARLADRRPTRLSVLTPRPTVWEPLFRQAGVVPRAAPWQAMADEVRASHAGLSVCRLDAGVSLKAAMPTKVAEFLASGRPVVVNQDLGDLDTLVRSYACGVVIADVSDHGVEEAAAALESLLDDPETPGRCRKLAEDHFDVDIGVNRLVGVYERALSAPP